MNLSKDIKTLFISPTQLIFCLSIGPKISSIVKISDNIWQG